MTPLVTLPDDIEHPAFYECIQDVSKIDHLYPMTLYPTVLNHNASRVKHEQILNYQTSNLIVSHVSYVPPVPLSLMSLMSLDR